VLYKDAVDANFSVKDFDVSLVASFAPMNATTMNLPKRWELVSGPNSGYFATTNDFIAAYKHPKKGGVYRFRFTVGEGGTNGAFGEASVVLPLAGAEMDDIMKADLVRADAFAQWATNKYTLRRRTDTAFLNKYFYDNNTGDYVGRPDNSNSPMVWYYGQVATSGLSGDMYGLGCVCTWKGHPVLLGKLSNFITAYAAQKIGVPYWKTQLARWLPFVGTIDGTTGAKSWDAGWDVAQGQNYDTVVTGLVDYIWKNEAADDKTKRPWPNPSQPDNFVSPFEADGETFHRPDLDHEFTSPGFLYCNP
jgi:hypothetical protein